MRVLEGSYDGAGLRLALLVAHGAERLASCLRQAVLEALMCRGVRHWDIVVYRTPGIWELPLTARELALYGQFDALVVLGASAVGSRRARLLFREVLRGLARVSFRAENAAWIWYTYV